MAFDRGASGFKARSWEGWLRDGSPDSNPGERLHGSVSGDRDELHQSVRGWLACLKTRKPIGIRRGLPQSGRAPFGAAESHLARLGAAGAVGAADAIWRGGAPLARVER